MIKTKQPKIVNAQTGQQDVIYLDLLTLGRDCKTGNWIIAIGAYTLANNEYLELSVTTDFYTEAKFLELFGQMTIQTIIDTQDDMLIQQIGDNSVKFWGLKSNDLEKVVENT